MTDRYAVFGNPIAPSKSPQIHAAFAAQAQQNMIYERQQVEIGQFNPAAREFFDNGGKGLNITVPFKLDAYAFASQLTERAQQAGAVNTLALQLDGNILGDNTDGVGLVTDIVDNLGWQLSNRKILLLGAGGAVRGVLGPLLAQKPASIVVANRTALKAQELATLFGNNIKACGFDALVGESFDIVINGTSASLAGDLPPLPANLLNTGACCYDMMYGAKPTVFMTWAQQYGASSVADGLGMLVQQAAEAFYVWRGVRPQTTPVIAQLRAQLAH